MATRMVATDGKYKIGAVSFIEYTFCLTDDFFLDLFQITALEKTQKRNHLSGFNVYIIREVALGASRDLSGCVPLDAALK
jgi:hypothetical protein